MLASEFAETLAYAEPGACIEYHRGYLAEECREVRLRISNRKGSWGDLQEIARADATELERLRSVANQFAAGGHVHLVQRRIGPGKYAYLAVKAKT